MFNFGLFVVVYLGRLTDTNLRDIYLTRFLNVISECQ
jgi:hypothetical protein